MADTGELSVVLTPIQLYAILNGKSISAQELASNSWSEMPGPPRSISRYMQPMSSTETNAAIREYLAQNSGPGPSPGFLPDSALRSSGQNAYTQQSHYSQPNMPDCWIPPAAHRMTSTERADIGAGLQIVGAGLEILGGVLLILAPEPTMLTKVAGGVMTAHGVDYMQAAVRQLFSGNSVEDFTEQGTTWAARKAGASEQNAHRIGVVMDVSVGLVDVGLGAYKLVAIRMGRVVLPAGAVVTDAERISLRAEEKLGGHTKLKHIDRTSEQLADRLPLDPHIPASSAWTSVRVAENVISYTLRLRQSEIRAWIQAGAKGTLPLRYSGTLPLGRGIVRATGKEQSMTNALVRLKKSQKAGRDFFILTAFPNL